MRIEGDDMLTEYLRDHAFAVMWLALMSGAWLGWSQEEPKPRWRPWLGAGSVIGLLSAFAFAALVWRNWDTPTALNGQYWMFGLLVVIEVAFIGIGCFVLARRGASRWFAWWAAVGVALHFVPLAWLFGDWSYAVLTVVQLAGLFALLPRLSRDDHPTSRWAAPWMGWTFLAFAAVSGVVFIARHGYAW